MTKIDLSNMHFGRSWSGHPLEDNCPCPKAPCGLVDGYAEGCNQHDPSFAKTMRQRHQADQCPAVQTQNGR